MRAGDLDQAVSQYRAAVQAAPDNTDYKIALQRAMQAASRAHLEKAKEYEDKDQLEAALSEYKLATEYEPSNRLAAAKVAALDRIIRERVEAARPKPQIDVLRERARASSPEPFLNPASRAPIHMNFNSSSLKEILTTLSNLTGINILYDREVTDHAAQAALDNVTLEQALNQILSTNQLSYKIINERDDPRVPRHDDQASAVRRAGRQDDLPLELGPDGRPGDPQQHRPLQRHGDPAGDCT